LKHEHQHSIFPNMAFTTTKLSTSSRSLFIRCIAILIPLSTVLLFLFVQNAYSLHFFKDHNSDTRFPASCAPSSNLLDSDAPTYLSKFAIHESYESLSSEHDVLWDALLPPNGGFVVTYDDKDSSVDDEIGHHDHKSHHHDNTNENHRQLTEKGKKKHSTGISMFHQLHCLGMLRGAIQTLYSRIEELEWERDTHGSNDLHQHESEKLSSHKHARHDHFAGHDHWAHCFDYLRQVRPSSTHVVLFSWITSN